MMHPQTKPSVAILTPNVLMGLGLKTILEKVIPMAEIFVFGSYVEFFDSNPTNYAHYFVATQTFVQHNTFFREHHRKTILLGNGRSTHTTGMRSLDIFASEQRLMHDLLRLRHQASRPDHTIPQHIEVKHEILSAREVEVLTLIAQGLLNKQVAAQLGIGLTTVISHRRNIMEKLGVTSVAGLVICAVSMGYANTDDTWTPHK